MFFSSDQHIFLLTTEYLGRYYEGKCLACNVYKGFLLATVYCLLCLLSTDYCLLITFYCGLVVSSGACYCLLGPWAGRGREAGGGASHTGATLL